MAGVGGNRMMLGLVLCAGVLAMPLWSWGQSGEPIGKVLAVEGVAEVRAAQATEWERLRFRDGIFLNDTVRTATDSKLKVLLQDDSIMTLAEQSEMQFTEFLLTDQQRRSIVNLFVGKLRLLTTRLFGAGSLAEIHTPNAVAGVRGSDEYVSHDPRTQKTTVLCASGGGVQGDHCYLRDPQDLTRILDIRQGHIAEQTGAVLPSATRAATAIEQQAIIRDTQIIEQDPQETRPTDEQPPAGTPRGETTGTTPTGPPPSTMIATTAIPPASDVRSDTIVSPTLAGPTSRQDNPQDIAISDPSVSPAAQDIVRNSMVGITIVIPRPR